MGNTPGLAIAGCTVESLTSVDHAVLIACEHFTSHPDQLPPSLNELNSRQFPAVIKPYLQIIDDELTITYDETVDSINDFDIYKFLAYHFACLQTSKYMHVCWSLIDSDGDCRFGRSG